MSFETVIAAVVRISVDVDIMRTLCSRLASHMLLLAGTLLV